MKIVGRLVAMDDASHIGEIEPEGGGSRVTTFAADLEAAGIALRPGVRLIFSVGNRNGATAAVDLERYYPAPEPGKPLERGVHPMFDEFEDLVRTVRSRETAVKSREASAIAWEKRLAAQQQDLTALELATVVRLQNIEHREAAATSREEALTGREATLKAAEERHVTGAARGRQTSAA